MNWAKSGWENVLSWISKGNGLGPVLFVIYITDMPHEIVNFYQMFADEKKLYIKVN